MRRCVAALLALLVSAGALAGCDAGQPTAPPPGPSGPSARSTAAPSRATAPPGHFAGAPTVDPRFVYGTDGSDADRLAATAVTDVQAFWRQTFPAVFGGPWRDVAQFRSVDTADAGVSEAPPCTSSAAELAGDALYCPTSDTVSWDRSALIPVLREKFGDTAVLVVLAHEIGHAVQRRSGVTEGAPGYPTIVTESMADCYSGAAVRWLADGHGAHLRPGKPALDQAMQALVTFHDPVGRAADDTEAHGDAFDRVSAFTDGYQSGAGLCKGISASTRTFTQARFTAADGADGNLPYDRLLADITPDIVRWLRGLAPGFTPPPQRPVAAPCAGQGPAGFCPAATGPGVIEIGPDLRALHQRIGDWASGTVVTSRYALALRQFRHQPVRGPAARTGALCLAGAYTAVLLARPTGFGLSPGDVDESVRLLLDDDAASRDVTGAGIGSGFDRLLAFRAGVTGGAGRC